MKQAIASEAQKSNDRLRIINELDMEKEALSDQVKQLEAQMSQGGEQSKVIRQLEQEVEYKQNAMDALKYEYEEKIKVMHANQVEIENKLTAATAKLEKEQETRAKVDDYESQASATVKSRSSTTKKRKSIKKEPFRKQKSQFSMRGDESFERDGDEAGHALTVSHGAADHASYEDDRSDDGFSAQNSDEGILERVQAH